MSWSICLWLGVISLALSLLVFFISQKAKNHIVEAIVIPILTIGGFLFDDSANFLLRIKVVAVLIAFYVGFYFFWNLISRIVFKLKGNAKAEADQPKTHISIHLPLDYSHEVDNRFIEDIPANVESLIHMSEEMRLLTEDFIKTFKSWKDDNERETALKSYFLGLCYHLASLFDNSTRVHVRILEHGCYDKFVATYSGHEYENNMKTMSLENKMIKESFTHNRSLIKIHNTDLHEEGSSHKWKNYLMFALPQIVHDNRPVFSMGISVTRKKNDLFYFLNYCEIESIIGGLIEKIIKSKGCKVQEFIERFYFA